MEAYPSEVAAGRPAGWYADPWKLAAWRWWDGAGWTGHVHSAVDAKPRLQSWLSVPVAFGLVATVLSLVVLLALSPLATLLAFVLGLVPLAIVFPVLAWLDRVEPEPLASRVHAMLWGACVAGFVSGVVNSVVAFQASEAWAAVVSAPIIEEIMKGLGIYWAVRRREVDGVMDGIVYAGWVGLGFAIVEDITYFANAAEADILGQVFVVRALLTPFAHPLFTAWTGLGIGLAIRRGQSLWLNAAWGLGLAIVCHAAWNGTLTFAGDTGQNGALAVVAACFVVLFVAAAATVVLLRRAEKREFTELVPLLAQRHGLNRDEVSIFSDWKRTLATRRSLPRGQRPLFDQVHASLARLALFYRRPPASQDAATAELLANQLQHARANQIAAQNSGP
jgi:RsiW-degrading membrane proteinase PrsW (M82 family)